jgi:TonB-dependent starch-binding outer membrane protein SusC
VLLASSMDRATVRLNLDSDLTSRLSVSNSLMMSRVDGTEVPAGEAGAMVHNAFLAPPTIAPYDESGNYTDYSHYWWWGAYSRNPVRDANELTNRQVNLRVLGNVSGDYKLLDGLRLRSLFGVDYLDSNSQYYATRLHEFGSGGGSGSMARGENLTYLNENTVNFNRDLGNQRIYLTGGFTWQRAENTGLSQSVTGFVSDAMGVYGLSSGENVSRPNASFSDWTLLSWLGRANYALNDRYLFTLSGRYDGSSRFGAGNKWAFFPSAAVAWRLSQEPFLASVEMLSDLKLRASWGRTGNQEIGIYQSLQRVGSQQLVMGDNRMVTGFTTTNMPNPDLRWETTDQYNAGIDLGLWQQRLTLSADVYRKDTYDLLAQVDLPTSSGFWNVTRNLGEIQNTGVEVGLGMVPVQTSRVTWTVDANASHNRNRVVRLADGKPLSGGSVSFLLGSVHRIEEGKPLAFFYGFQEDGYDNQGNIRYLDQNGDGVINDLDRVDLGSPLPSLNYGLSSGLTVGSFDVSAMLQGVHGNKILNHGLAFSASSFARGENQIADVYGNYWTPERTDAKYPRLNTAATFRFSDRFIEDGSYLRLRNVRVGYRLPASLARGFDSMHIYVSGQNLLTLTGYSWFDPEVSYFGGANLQPGVDLFTYPNTRTVTLGVRIGM